MRYLFLARTPHHIALATAGSRLSWRMGGDSGGLERGMFAVEIYAAIRQFVLVKDPRSRERRLARSRRFGSAAGPRTP
jgi:hypothetical protein